MALDPTSAARPGPRPGTTQASQPPGVVGVRSGPNGRPPGPAGTAQPPPPDAGGAPAAGGAGGGGGVAMQPAPVPQPGQQAPGQPGPPGVPAGPGLEMLPDGAAVQSPMGTYIQTPQGPRLVLNEQGVQAYQRRMEKFYAAYKADMPPELQASDFPIPDVQVGQRILLPWSGQWVTV